ncbi:LuxR family transcriptional regulator [Pseudomonas sp. TH31]|uniref:LuxR family transcriptional regulator n=1 Tax=Pseudomonas sp. TH31 TaxID=2796396 RepID=UPI0019147D7F|nr:LuxR family transcriptional regulator [Pseudomonas sp. TH31]MBK5413973.1 LuxR family transcriptional regulator [Pseudomonas sp. TH31]
MDIDNKPYDNNSTELISRVQTNLELELRRKGFRRFTYFIARKANIRKAFLMSNFPLHWIKQYKLGSLHLTDPIIQFGLRATAPYSSAEIQSMTAAAFKFFEKVKRYPITDGYCFTLHDANGCFSLLSVCNRLDPARGHLLEQHKAELQMLLIRVHQLMVASPQLLDLIFDENSTKPLTQREHEILKWASIGKTYSEISLITSISVRTVKFHMRNIVEKLDVANAKHAISKAQQDGLCLQIY